MTLFSWLYESSTLATIKIPVGGFRSDCTRAFTEKLGELHSLEPSLATATVAFIREIQNNPYDPSVVKRCFAVSEDNLLFKAYIKPPTIFMVWRIESSKFYSVRGEDWTIRFLKIKNLG